ncbi:hypothetical protein D3C77_632470 [compost metagenome]
MDFKDTKLYNKECFTLVEGEKTTSAKWLKIDEILSGKKILYPNGLTDVLYEMQN